MSLEESVIEIDGNKIIIQNANLNKITIRNCYKKIGIFTSVIEKIELENCSNVVLVSNRIGNLKVDKNTKGSYKFNVIIPKNKKEVKK